jgi:hypothetical protein
MPWAPLGPALAVAVVLMGVPAPGGADHGIDRPTVFRAPARPATGPLRVSHQNPRYFETPAGDIVYLTGSHTWANLQDNGTKDPPPAFDFTTYLAFLRQRGHNFFRLWTWEQLKWSAEIKGDYWFRPVPYQRSGPGLALDGKPKVDLTRFDPAYFDRLRDRVREAGAAGIYVSVMLFNGWSVGTKGALTYDNPWKGHPFNAANNVNGIDGDLNHDGLGYETQTLVSPAITRLQEAYVREVIDAVNGFDNVLYEIANEGDSTSRAWQYHMIAFVKQYEAGKPKQHPVGMTSIWPGGRNADLFLSDADWIAPSGPSEDRPVASGAKVILSDTDHFCGTCGSIAWVWKSFTRGENPALMDGYDGAAIGVGAEDFWRDDPKWEPIRRNLGYAWALTTRLHLGSLVPRPDLASTGFCLASTTERAPQYVAYAPWGGNVFIDLSASAQRFTVTWLNPATGELQNAGTVVGAATRLLSPPFMGAAVLFLH